MYIVPKYQIGETVHIISDFQQRRYKILDHKVREREIHYLIENKDLEDLHLSRIEWEITNDKGQTIRSTDDEYIFKMFLIAFISAALIFRICAFIL